MSRVLVDTIVFSIPEAFVVVFLASCILGKEFKWTSLVVIAIAFGAASPLIRQVTGAYILNIIVSSLVLIVLLKLFGRYDIFEAATAALMAVSIYLAIEFLNVKSLQTLTGIDPIRLEHNPILRMLWFLPQILATTGLAFTIKYFNSRQSSDVKYK